MGVVLKWLLGNFSFYLDNYPQVGKYSLGFAMYVRGETDANIYPLLIIPKIPELQYFQ